MLKKKQKVYGGGGGAWKVAYADFVTAMMALFMVLWISAQSEEIILSTAYYFQNPLHSPFDKAAGGIHTGGGAVRSNQQSQPGKNSVADLSLLHALANEFYKLFDLEEGSKGGPVQVEVMDNKLKIVIFNRSDQPLFKDDSSDLTEWAKFSLSNLAWLIDRHELLVSLDAHESSAVISHKASKLIIDEASQHMDDSGEAKASSWSLSSNRGITVADYLVEKGLSQDKLYNITSYADHEPKEGTNPTDDSNDRIEISLTPKDE